MVVVLTQFENVLFVFMRFFQGDAVYFIDAEVELSLFRDFEHRLYLLDNNLLLLLLLPHNDLLSESYEIIR